MGREFASAAARWFHLPQMDARPTIDAAEFGTILEVNAGLHHSPTSIPKSR